MDRPTQANQVLKTQCSQMAIDLYVDATNIEILESESIAGGEQEFALMILRRKLGEVRQVMDEFLPYLRFRETQS